MQYFTADTHFYGKRIIVRENRPFKSPEDFVEREIYNWNKITTKNDIIYCIGDFLNYSSIEQNWKMH